MRLLPALLACVLGGALAGCSAGAGGFVANDETGDLGSSTGDAVAAYQVLDLQTGDVSPRDSIPDLATNPSWRDGRMVFRRIDAGSATLGSRAGSPFAQADEAAHGSSIPRFYMSVFETTQAQWQRVVGTTPWADVTPAGVGGGSGGSLPAYGLSRDLVVQALDGRVGGHLALPSANQWEAACRAGGNGDFAWGNDPDESQAQVYARVAETAGGATGPVAVGSLAANAYGLFDMHGNVWELVADGTIRGGSWRNTVLQARCANKVAIDRSTAHALVGVRLVLVP